MLSLVTKEETCHALDVMLKKRRKTDLASDCKDFTQQRNTESKPDL